MLNYYLNRSLNYKLGAFTKQGESDAPFMHSQQIGKNGNTSCYPDLGAFTHYFKMISPTARLVI